MIVLREERLAVALGELAESYQESAQADAARGRQLAALAQLVASRPGWANHQRVGAQVDRLLDELAADARTRASARRTLLATARRQQRLIQQKGSR